VRKTFSKPILPKKQSMSVKTILSLAIVVVLSSFTPDTDIIGEWKLDQKTVDKTVKGAIERVDKANPAMASQVDNNKEVVVEMVQALRMNFKADHTFNMQSKERKQSGKWNFINNGHELRIISTDGKLRKDSVLEITATRMVLINKKLSDTIVYIRP
jgi:hypothetical protein